jgi:RsiW-degrading membrane proteinase PrsW (M82 family)
MFILAFALLVVLPIALWILFIRYEDRSEPEPGRLMRRCFVVGVSAGIAAAIVEVVIFKILGVPEELTFFTKSSAPFALTVIAMLLIGPIEELAKYIVLRWNVYYSHDFNQIFDGIVYGITIALGFSFIENAGYFIDLYLNQTTSIFLITAIYRAIFTTLAHVVSTGIMGYYVGKAKFATSGKVSLILNGVFAAMLIHSFFDFMLSGLVPYGPLIDMVVIVVLFFVFFRVWKHPDVRMVWKFVPATPTDT